MKTWYENLKIGDKVIIKQLQTVNIITDIADGKIFVLDFFGFKEDELEEYKK